MVMLLRLQDLGESHASQLDFLLTSLHKRPFAYKTNQNLHKGLILINNQTHHTNHPTPDFILHSLRIKKKSHYLPDTYFATIILFYSQVTTLPSIH